MRVNYDQSHDPPAPVLSCRVSGTVIRRPRTTLSALIDTGSDITAIPDWLERRYRLEAIGRLRLEGIGESSSIVYTYEAIITVGDFPPRRLEVVLTHYPFVILARDWLRHYHLLLKGPMQELELRNVPFDVEEKYDDAR